MFSCLVMPILIKKGIIHQAFHKLHINLLHFLAQLCSSLPSDSPRKFQLVESLPSKKKDPQKKGVRIEKQKRRNLIWSGPCYKKKKGWNLQSAGRDSIKRKAERGSHFSIAQNRMYGLIHTHTSFAFALPSIHWLFPFLPPFTTPFSINHDYLPHKLFRIFVCFYNIQGVAQVPLESEPPQKY
jgi:hypothetical protein